MIVPATLRAAGSRRPRWLGGPVAARLALLVAALPAAAAAQAAAAGREAASLKFEKTFTDAAEPAALHYKAEFVSRGASHQMELWRDGQTHLRRRTDAAIETYVVRKPGSADYQMVILDMPHKIVTRIDRTNLYRVGNFTDWFDLAHGLKHPKGSYQLASTAAPSGVPRPLAACNWYDLTQSGHTVHVCWSARSRVPMLLVDQGGAVVWKLTQLDQRPIEPATFQVHAEGFVQNDANADMDRD